MPSHKVAGLSIVAVPVGAVVPNDWNPNRMSEEMFQKAVRSIQEYGFVDPLTVRELGGKFQIVDGEHRHRAAKHLGMKEVPATNLGVISDTRAKKLTLLFNELRGEAEPARLSVLLADLAVGTSLDDLAAALPFTRVEIETLVGASVDFDWSPPPVEVTPISGVGAERRFQLGTIRGDIPKALADALLAEFARSAQAVGSKGAEAVLRDWLARLKRAEPEAKSASAALSP